MENIQAGGRVAQHGEKALPSRFVNLPPPCRRPGGGQVVRLAALAVISAAVLQEKTPAAGVLSFTYCPNMERNVPIFASSMSFRPLSVSGLTISAGFGCFASSGCRLPDGQRVELVRPPPLPVCRSAGNIDRRVTPLPSPPLGGACVSFVLRLPSLVVVAVCCWCVWLVVWCDDLRQVVEVCDVVRYYITYNRARNKRARTRGN